MLMATLIGDVVGSRASGDRVALHARLQDLIEEVNQSFDPVTPLRFTIGDEYQGAFASVGQAVQASLRLRLGLRPSYDVRHGVGWGEVAVLTEEPRVEDGPGWWAARDAIHAVQEAQERPGSRWLRTAFRSTTPEMPAGLVEAVLVLRDERVSGLSDRSVSVLRGLLSGSTQREIAAELGISPSAVSQRVRADGLAALVAADESIGRPAMKEDTA